MAKTNVEKLAILGGPKSVTIPAGDLFSWPIITKEDEDAVLEVLRRGAMSGTEVTKQFEAEFKAWMGTSYALGYPSGTESLRAAMWACGVGLGDEIICPSMTYWASGLPALQLGASINFADIEPKTLCIDPKDIEHRICKKTKAIVVVHYAGHPCDMDPIMAIAKKHKIKVIEDVSHAQGGLYKGRMLGTIGDIGAMSLMSGKSLAIGEAGIIVTNDSLLYQRCIAYGHYERTGMASNYNAVDKQVTDPQLAKFAGLPIGGFKHRMHQLSSACGRVQLKHYPDRMAVIQKAMNYFWDALADIKGLDSMRPKWENSTKGGWYACKGYYDPKAFGGLPLAKFAEAVVAEGSICAPGTNFPLHLHPLLQEGDVIGAGKPALTMSGRDLRQGPGSLPVCESIKLHAFGIPWFKHFYQAQIDEHIKAYRKVAEQYKKLLK